MLGPQVQRARRVTQEPVQFLDQDLGDMLWQQRIGRVHIETPPSDDVVLPKQPPTVFEFFLGCFCAMQQKMEDVLAQVEAIEKL
ncbi:hypothetical protein MVEG_11817 [Podila verticillata NRRL 6337]|uniref:Uncharacterized protein n=1 Tax=Podila verticillata NRRL 6337 TaxID=1069443 RepID=A0A086TJQ1_9FUNG|nr:hypothetical protein MVEG_11817 [Podila verticillata NRRL 6337]